MHFTMVCIGSTGDVRPYLVLGRELMARRHSVTLCAFNDFEKAARDAGMEFRGLFGDAKTLMSTLMNRGAAGFKYIKQIKDALEDIIGPFLKDLQDACEDAEVIIGTYFGAVISSIAEAKRVPFIQTHYFMMDYNDLAPMAAAPGQGLGKAWNKFTYRAGYLLTNTMEVYYLDDWRRAQGMAPHKITVGPVREINGHSIPILYAMSPLLMPRPLAWDENIHMTGFWVDEHAMPYTPSPELEAFLENGEKPVYVGFGSMSGRDMRETMLLVLEAIRLSGIRAVISTGWGGIALPVQENVFITEFVPHDWLFERVSAVVHHGGAGTTASGIMAGRPSLLIPFGGDQPFWAMRARMLGIGPRPIRRDKLTVRGLANALRQLTTVKSYRVAARELGERLRMENGAQTAANIIEHEVGKWLGQDGKA